MKEMLRVSHELYHLLEVRRQLIYASPPGTVMSDEQYGERIIRMMSELTTDEQIKLFIVEDRNYIALLPCDSTFTSILLSTKEKEDEFSSTRLLISAYRDLVEESQNLSTVKSPSQLLKSKFIQIERNKKIENILL